MRKIIENPEKLNWLFLLLCLAACLSCFAQKKDRSLRNSLGAVTLAAGMNALMDTQKDHYGVSVFKNADPNFWNPNVSWATSKTVAGYHIDAWHIEKSIMVGALFVPVAELMHRTHPIIKGNVFWDKALWWSITGFTWNLVFNVNYEYVLKR